MTSLTKKAIKAAFLELLGDRPLSQITVKDIVDRCGINRNSFYYHFQDIPTLIEEIAMEETDKIIMEHPTVDSMEIGFNIAIEFMKQHRTEILHIYNSVNRDIFEQYLWRVADHVVTMFAETAFKDKTISDYDKEVITAFYRCQCFGVAINWLQNGVHDDVQDRIRRICELQKGMIEEMINRCTI